MTEYLVRRLVLSVPVVLGVSIAVFLMMHLIPGDPALAMLRGQPTVTPADIDRVRHQLGLDDPLPVQYLKYISRVVRGDFGESVHSHRPVLGMIGEQAWSTVQLAVAAMVLAVAIGVILGTISALRQNSWVDTLSMIVALFGVSMPNFWLGLLLIYVFSLRLGWFPITGEGGWQRLVLPAVALGMDFSAITARLVRASLLEVLRQDYILTARAKGLRERVVVTRHALRNAMIAVVTIIGLQFGFLLSGAVVVETVFARQGIGRLAITAILSKDFPLVQGIVLVAAVAYVAINLLVDLSYSVLDPRIHYN
ncbi:MAG: peptide/nickel transport system permease protein [Thermomicrobiales bacterium]|jgi:peptide/nickel transport system permease protein|nr:peptide/nickel transport system permease protein [Thermomicrobiales bacterium]MEA2530812.1 peptide/nickel transport system permease protein [Thermomicrobiales bacterium]MEA2597167.1 peptide/nickel transport system permease protein [Thermomicrobiales bacterium]